MWCWHGGDRNSHSAASDFPCFKISLITPDCAATGKATRHLLVFPLQGEETTLGQVQHRELRGNLHCNSCCFKRGNSYAHAFPLTSSFPGQLCIPSHPIHQNGSASLLEEDRPGIMKLFSTMLCCWHDMGPAVRAEEYYHTL